MLLKIENFYGSIFTYHKPYYKYKIFIIIMTDIENNNEWGQFVFLTEDEMHISKNVINQNNINDPAYYFDDDYVDYSINRSIVKSNNDKCYDEHPIIYFVGCVLNFINFLLIKKK